MRGNAIIENKEFFISITLLLCFEIIHFEVNLVILNLLRIEFFFRGVYKKEKIFSQYFLIYKTKKLNIHFIFFMKYELFLELAIYTKLKKTVKNHEKGGKRWKNYSFLRFLNFVFSRFITILN